MIKEVEEYGKYVKITGFRNVSFDQADAFLKAYRTQKNQQSELQFFEADLIATKDHLYFAILNALQAFRYKINISKSLAMETMLYAAAHRQIKKAIARIGINPATNSMAVIIIAVKSEYVHTQLNLLSKSLGSKPDDSVLDLTGPKIDKIKDIFQISIKQIQTQPKGDKNKAIVDLIIEKMALVATHT